jgi:hypothetical protein
MLGGRGKHKNFINFPIIFNPFAQIEKKHKKSPQEGGFDGKKAKLLYARFFNCQ